MEEVEGYLEPIYPQSKGGGGHKGLSKLEHFTGIVIHALINSGRSTSAQYREELVRDSIATAKEIVKQLENEGK